MPSGSVPNGQDRYSEDNSHAGWLFLYIQQILPVIVVHLLCGGTQTSEMPFSIRIQFRVIFRIEFFSPSFSPFCRLMAKPAV